MDHRFPRITGFHTTTHKYYMYHRLLEDHRFPRIEFHTSSLKSQGSLAPSLTTESRLSPGDDFLGIYLGAQRARTRWLGAPRAGVERRHFGAGPLSSTPPLPGHRPSQNSPGGFHNLQCCQRIHERGRESLTDVPPKGKFWPPTPFTCPCPNDYHLICRLYWSFSTFTVLVEFGKRQVRPHEGTWCNDWKDGPNFPKVSCLANNFLLQGVEHFLKEWVCWLLPGRRGETYIVSQSSSSSHLPTENIW